jgi:hypothetical protein
LRFKRVGRETRLGAAASPSASSRSPRQRHESGVISLNVQRIGVPSGKRPSCTTSFPCRRAISSARTPSSGLNQNTRQARIDGSKYRNVVPYQLANFGESALRSDRSGLMNTS